MNETLGANWRSRYSALTAAIQSLPKAAGSCQGGPLSQGVFLCGMSTVVDARADMHDMDALANAPPASRAHDLFKTLQDRAARGVGGEIKFDWPEGPDWLRGRITLSHALGGTGPQAAWVLSKLGARAVIALEDRHPFMLKQIPPGVLVAQHDKLVDASEIVPREPAVPETFIFEYTAGRPIGDVIPRRSSRIIVRFLDRGLQDDSEFDKLSVRLASSAAAGLLSGLNDTAFADLPQASEKLFALARAWRAKGLKTIHFELAGYSSKEALSLVLADLRGSITSIGMSHSELIGMYPDAELPLNAMISLGERLGLDRVCVHADTWAAAVTKSDPNLELSALMTGCAIASARAANGSPVDVVTLAPEAEFQPLPFEAYARRGEWTFVACSAPFLERPQTTLGLGDSFTAGCLLVLGHKTQAHGAWL
ncbi:ADP-dependent phosphofructokinase/glucokinase [Mesorhizobium robiniae]|uniref:ADP-dependent phosphofructokinase/glucokinase n=1 Tax=Mesorhizobium robiniae TaxID=559315 RepID=A0ABV2GXH9_9HYPH|nr:ADP-dependent glucokinase/phosphofructokinase [Mesorhizobium sp. ZC-5]MCV3243423.1 6-phosphofructokinase [Mesorhizobium sp. ZC-5]